MCEYGGALMVMPFFWNQGSAAPVPVSFEGPGHLIRSWSTHTASVSIPRHISQHGVAVFDFTIAPGTKKILI